MYIIIYIYIYIIYAGRNFEVRRYAGWLEGASMCTCARVPVHANMHTSQKHGEWVLPARKICISNTCTHTNMFFHNLHTPVGTHVHTKDF